MAKYRHLSHGFEPVFDSRSRVLVLGSFPSEKSRENDFYYGNPLNRFWKTVASCVGEKEPMSIEDKRSMLLEHGIALWDVIAECDIKGSSDSSIKNVVPAHIETVIECSRIEKVICNGAVAGKLYRRYIQWKTGMEAVTLPSTSPANAKWGLEDLTGAWKVALGYLPALPKAEVKDAYAPARCGKGDREASRGEIGIRGTSRIVYASVTLPPPASSYSVHVSMQGNKGRNTKPELIVRKRLCAAGLTGYRLHWKAAGRPDVAWPGKKVCIFVNGCYWHRCPHCKPSMPKTNAWYWDAKFKGNVERDERNLSELEKAGWRVHVIWECQLKKSKADTTFSELLPILAEELGKELALPPAAENPRL